MSNLPPAKRAISRRETELEFTVLVGFQALRLGIFVFLFTHLDRRVDQIASDIKDLRRDLAEEFRVQRAEIAAQVTAIAAAINARRT
jgi:hypothetical protein